MVTEPSRDGGREGTSDIEEGRQPVQAVGGAEAGGEGLFPSALDLSS